MCEVPWNIEQKWNGTHFGFAFDNLKRYFLVIYCLPSITYVATSEMASILLHYWYLYIFLNAGHFLI